MSGGCELGRNLVRGHRGSQTGPRLRRGKQQVREAATSSETLSGAQQGRLEAPARALPGSNRANPEKEPLGGPEAASPKKGCLRVSLICCQLEGKGLCPGEPHM